MLVAIAIIGTLASSAFFGINPAGQFAKAHDAQRKSDLEQIKNALDTYYSDNNQYPDGSGGLIAGKNWGDPWPPYMAKIPKDPLSPSQDYFYESPPIGTIDTSAYRLYANLERCSDSQNTIGVDCLRVGRNYSINSSNLAMLALLTPTPTPTPTPIPTPTPTPLPSKKVFVSSQRYNGNLGGLSGADVKCQALANNAALGGVWKAWLSSSSTSAASRLSHSLIPYKLVDGTLVANNWNDLTDGVLVNPINKDESRIFKFTNYVWTNTLTGGFANSNSCSDWTNNTSAVSANMGSTGSAGSEWTAVSGSISCDGTIYLYCFEQ